MYRDRRLSDQGAKAGQKPADRGRPRAVPEFSLVSLSTRAVTLIYGRDERGRSSRHAAADHLDVTVLITRRRI